MDRDEFVRRVEGFSFLGSDEMLNFDNKAREGIKRVYDDFRNRGLINDDNASDFISYTAQITMLDLIDTKDIFCNACPISCAAW